MIDTHAHIDAEVFDSDRHEVLERARSAGVEAVIIPAINPCQTMVAEHIVDEYPWVYRAVGLHPHYAQMATPSLLDYIEQSANNYHVVAIGEIGLDYYYDFSPPSVQQNVFREQVRIAKRVGLPVIIHNREADQDILDIIDREQDGSLHGVLHCFSSSVEIMKRALALGVHVSFTGNITFPRWKDDELLRALPEDCFMLETDSPYMTPVPHRGKRNEPAFIRFIAERLAQIRSTMLENIIMQTTATARKLFRLSVLFVSVCFSVSYSQSDGTSEDGLIDEEHPYPKFIGIGLLVGPNTIVETQTRQIDNITQPISYEGIPSFGGSAIWEFADRWMFDVAYIYSQNRKVVKSPDNPYGFQDNPDYYHVLEFGTRYLINPYSRVVFYGFLGASSVWISRNAGPYSAPKWCVAPGLGLFINIPTPFGMVVPGGEWRLSFFLQEEIRFVGQPNGEFYKAQVSTFFSIPRFTLFFFPRW